MPSFDFENRFPVRPVAGVDEVGYGAWAGPIVVGAAILDPTRCIPALAPLLADSKRLSDTQRRRVMQMTQDHPQGISFSLWTIPVSTLNAGHSPSDSPPSGRPNVSTWTLAAMACAVIDLGAEGPHGHLHPAPEWIAACHLLRRQIDPHMQAAKGALVDGTGKLPLTLPQESLIQGDSQSATIALASILAKIHRDDLMIQLHEDHPIFDWRTNKGYGTRLHADRIRIHGLTPHHRIQYCRKVMPAPPSFYDATSRHPSLF